MGIMKKIKIYAEMIKFEHSIFALPFAYFGAFLSQMKVPSFKNLLWITVAMVGARSFAMAINRIIDIELDKLNPRTSGRALPKGILSVKNALLFSLISLIVFLTAVYHLAPLCRYLWPFVILPFVIYPYTKRFTYLSHFLLGICLGLAPVGAWIAINNSISFEPFLIATAVVFWVSGFDIFYAIQDIEFDRKHGLYSIPARFGVKKSLMIIKLLHFFSIVFLTLVGLTMKLGIYYFAGVIITSIVLTYENTIVKPDDLSRLNIAFFNLNGLVSIILFIFVAIEITLRSGHAI